MAQKMKMELADFFSYVGCRKEVKHKKTHTAFMAEKVEENKFDLHKFIAGTMISNNMFAPTEYIKTVDKATFNKNYYLHDNAF